MNWIKLSHQLICVAACVFLCAFILENRTLSICFAGFSTIVLLICVVFLIVKTLQNKELGFMQCKDCDFFWTGFYLISSVLMMNNAYNQISVILGLLSMYHAVSMIWRFVNSTKD